MSADSFDHTDQPGLPLSDLEKFLSEIRYQPAWRRNAAKECAYYDGNQLDSVTLQAMEKLGIPPLVTNLIAPTVDVLLGMEAKTRADCRVVADTDDYQDLAEAMSVKLKEAERESYADNACSDAYAGQVKAGLHWVEVAREFDPFKYPYRVEAVHRDEIWWDWKSKRRDLDDARYLVRKQWKDVDILKMVLPKHKALIDMLQRFDRSQWDDYGMQRLGVGEFQRAFDAQFGCRIDQSEWWDSERKRLTVYEVWYRIYQRGWFMKLPDGRTLEVDLKNPRHSTAILENMVQPFEGVTAKMRMSFWLGPHRVIDLASPRNHFPYVPFWGKREDGTGIPYGLIRAMMSPQDEINARDAKMMWMLSARRVVADHDAVKDHDRARREVSRPDAYITLNENRKPTSKFEVDDDIELSEQQFKVREERKQSLQAAAGVYQQMLGDAKGGADSGIAIASLVEQGSITQAEINDNYRFARRMVFEYLLEFVREDIKPNTEIQIGGQGKPKKTVALNVPSKDAHGYDYLENSVQRDLFKVALDDVPSTPAYKAQTLNRLADMMKGMPPEAQAVIAPFFIRASDLPDRHKIADLLLKVLGVPSDPDNADPEKDRLTQMVGKLQQALAAAEGALTDKSDFEKGKLDIDRQKVAIAATDAETRRIAAKANISAGETSAAQQLIQMILDAANQAGMRPTGASA